MKFPKKQFKAWLKRNESCVKAGCNHSFEECHATWGFEQAKKQMLAKIKKKHEKTFSETPLEEEKEYQGRIAILEWLEGELK